MKDKLARYGVVIGGLGVIVAIALIFFYLLYVVFPLFLPASAESAAQYSIPDKQFGKTLLIAMEEQNEIGVRFTDDGHVVFFALANGKPLKTKTLPLPLNVRISSFARGDIDQGVVVYGLSDGRALVARHQYRVSYRSNRRTITPQLTFPLGEEPLLIDASKQPLREIAIGHNSDNTTIVAKTADHRMLLVKFEKQASLFGDDSTLIRTESVIETSNPDIRFLKLDRAQRNLFLADADGRLSFFDVSRKTPLLRQHLNVVSAGEHITSMEFLNGDLSLLVGDSGGLVGQWSVVRDEQNRQALQRLRLFKVSDRPILALINEQRRKGFMTVDASGVVGVYHTTAERHLLSLSVTHATPVAIALSPRANAFVLADNAGTMYFWHLHNEHPEVSFKSLWLKVWYESYPKPAYIWQSSSASNDFEPKFSLTPLVFGTVKAAFYAMLVAMPLAIFGAIYTAYFMAPRMRQLVKPGIEIMGALPSVILGFIGGLWLAPVVEEHLAGIFAMLLTTPLGVMLFAYGWQFVPERFRHKIPDGWDAALLIPVVVFSAWFGLAISVPLQDWLFNGDLRLWMKQTLDIGYDQRNSLIVGVAMGFAVIPTIFSIAEDAIFSVPKHLTNGSLALGATPWQTMVRVVLLTASPGIFSAVMIGLGRAVGETMIVLMATGNTPVMDFSLFQGMRTLSANIAVEMPESEVDSTHYRVLFLAALVLFLITFIFNTLAELIRQRLREKYSSL
ncbi:MAG: ABC transporter permease subunit [Gammaproteobacteria bacterium]